MSQIRIVVDSTADIPAAVRKELGIEMVPLKVHFGQETFLDAVSIEPADFYRKLASAPALPTTSQPSPVDFMETYKKLSQTSDTAIISIHLSSAMSGTYQSALLAKSMLENSVDVTVVDSKTASYGLGMLAVAAASAAKAGKSKEEILQMVQDIRDATSLYFIVDTLEFLQKGGRIGKASALFAALLNIKPILTIDESGEVAPVDKVRGQKRAVARIIELLKEDYEELPVRLAIVHTEELANAEELANTLREHFNIKDVTYTTIGPVIGTHAGPGTLGIFMTPVDHD